MNRPGPEVSDAARLSSGAGGVPVGPCPRCEREVVAYLVDEDAHACVHCDGEVRGVAWRDEADLGELGYSVADPLAAGCATGCGAGGCGPRPRNIDEMLARMKPLR